jgi:gamma-glutamyltranspeptidase/glutathione hydrolase
MTGSELDPARALLATNAVAAGSAGAVACTARSAAAAGAAALAAGGNALDAVLAAAMLETVLMPPKCGLAGELVGLVLPPGRHEPSALIALGPAAAGLAQHVARHGLASTGPSAVAVPAAPAGYAALAARSRFGLEAAVQPAIKLAERGIAWSPLCARLAAQADELLLRWQPDGCVYRPASGPLPVGTVLPLPGMAELLREFARAGAHLFDGPIGDTIVARVRGDGGVLEASDFAAAQAEWTAPAAHTFPAGTLYATPEPTYGQALLDVLAAAQRPEQLPELIATAAAPGDPRAPLLVDGTSVVAAVDAEGTAAVIVHSNSFPQFGSGLVVEDYDLVLSNRPGRGFSGDPSAPNAVRPGARPAATLHAWMLDPADGPALLGATSGGDHQIEWNAQLLTRLLAEPEIDLGTLLLDRRWERTAGGTRLEGWDDASSPLVGSSHSIVRRGDRSQAPAAAADPRLGGTAVSA